MADASVLGRFLWYDLMTTDPAGAIKFYGAVAGWGTTQWQGPTPYTMWTVGDGMIGGVMQLPPDAGAPPHWIGYIGAPDSEAFVGDAERLGGKVLVKPTDIPSVGKYAVLQDPQGAVFAIYTPANASPDVPVPPPVGHFSWHELATTDSAAASQFYRTLFKWDSIQDHDMGPMGIYRILGRGGKQMIGMFTRPPEMPGGPAWLHYIRVPSTDAAASTATAHGGKVINGPMDVPGGDRIAQIIDPQGGMFAVHSIAGS
jgi:predicted enzyme related to lactoylglutathione lyase